MGIDAVDRDILIACDAAKKVSSKMTMAGVTATNFAAMRAEIIKALAKSVEADEKDVDAKYIGTRRRSLSTTSNVEGIFTVAGDDTDIADQLGDANYATQ